MTDDDLMALCMLQEAGGEPDDGKAAVCRVVRNRMARLYESDGTVKGTILRFDQFSWAWFDFVDGAYTRIAWDQIDAANVAAEKLSKAPMSALAHCSVIAQQVAGGTYHGPAYDNLTDDTVLYVAPALERKMPVWATPAKLVCTIGRQNFYRA